MPTQRDDHRILRWRQIWSGLGVSAPDQIRADLIGRYCEPHRSYHTLQHLDECFAKLQELRALAVFPEEIELALWFHDAIYDVKRQDNEERSADWARSVVLAAGLSTTVAARLHALVMATRHDAVPDDIDQQILVDVDLAILGAEPSRFDEYERQIRAEYSDVGVVEFRRARGKVLTEFLKRPTIFNTERFKAAYEARARLNLARSIKALAADLPGAGPQ